VVDVGRPLHFPNGMCVDPDGEVAFLETLTPRLSKVVDGRAELIADLAGTSPDGVTVCADGGYLVAIYYPFQLLYVPPEGSPRRDDPRRPDGHPHPVPTTSPSTASLTKLAIGSLGGMVVKGIDLGIAGKPSTTRSSPP
jgi:hypothetical protein